MFPINHCFDFSHYLKNQLQNGIVLRHDIDRTPQNAYIFAKIQNNLGISGTYYFRIVPQSFQPKIIEQIAILGHEIGYHYEDVTLAAKSTKNEKLKIKNRKKSDNIYRSNDDLYIDNLLDRAIESFECNLTKLRQYADVKTICMHGSPMSKWDSRLLWQKYDYRDFGIIGEPYFDINFGEVAYYTDTGRRWDGQEVSVRDKAMWDKKRFEGWGAGCGVENGGKGEYIEHSSKHQLLKPNSNRQPLDKSHKPEAKSQKPNFPRFNSTFDIIRAAQNNELPDKIMFTFHPQRWTNNPVLWTKELVWQNVKNVVKRAIVKGKI